MHLHRVWEGRKTSPQSLPALAWPIGVGNITVLRLQGGAAGGREPWQRRLALAPALHREREHADRDPNPTVNMLVRQDGRRQPAGARVCRSAAAAH